AAKEAVKNAQAKVDSTKADYEKAQQAVKDAKPNEKSVKEKLAAEAKTAYEQAQKDLKAAEEKVKELEKSGQTV
ncbi:hypothetical protein, partial [Mycoplasma capricolum]|uniref:hypothetical protein n=1 Tax=Mycoplasma capricolum TaxID=2095 RepID=UPI0034DAD6C5